MKGWKLWAAIAAGAVAVWWYLKRQQQQPANIAEPTAPRTSGSGGVSYSNPLDLVKQLGQNVLSGISKAIPVTSKSNPVTAQLGASMMSQLDINKLAGQVGDALKGLFGGGAKGTEGRGSWNTAEAQGAIYRNRVEESLENWGQSLSTQSYSPGLETPNDWGFWSTFEAIPDTGSIWSGMSESDFLTVSADSYDMGWSAQDYMDTLDFMESFY